MVLFTDEIIFFVKFYLHFLDRHVTDKIIQTTFSLAVLGFDECLKKYSQKTNTIFQFTNSLCIAILIQ